MDLSTSPLPAAVIATRLGLTGLATSAITGTLTLTKTGTTARTATFPDAAIEVQAVDEEKSSNFTARFHATYIITGTCTVTDPTPEQGHEYIVFVRNGTCTIGGLGYIAGQTIKRSYHSGSWSSGVQAALGTEQAFSALQSFTAGLTVSAGTTAVQALTCTTLTASGGVTVSGGSVVDPGVRFASEATGLYRGSSTVLGVAISGSTALNITAPGGGYGTAFQLQAASGGRSYFYNSVNDGSLEFFPGTSGTTGGQIRLYASAHATKASQTEFLTDNTVRGYFNAAGLLTLTAGLTVSAGTTALQAVTCTTLTASGSGVLGTTALLASERLRVAGGTMGTPGATDVLVAAGKLSCGDTSATSIQTAGGATLGSGKALTIGSAQVVGAQGAAVADATDAATAITQLNALLARCRAHGLIA